MVLYQCPHCGHNVELKNRTAKKKSLIASLDFSTVERTFNLWRQLGPVFNARIGNDKSKRQYAVYECICGLVSVVKHHNVKNGNSCGCHRCIVNKHSLGSHYIYGIWNGMVQRCFNPKNTGFENYGGRGITVCDRWRKSVIDFYSDVGDRPTENHSLVITSQVIADGLLE